MPATECEALAEICETLQFYDCYAAGRRQDGWPPPRSYNATRLIAASKSRTNPGVSNSGEVSRAWIRR